MICLGTLMDLKSARILLPLSTRKGLYYQVFLTPKPMFPTVLRQFIVSAASHLTLSRTQSNIWCFNAKAPVANGFTHTASVWPRNRSVNTKIRILLTSAHFANLTKQVSKSLASKLTVDVARFWADASFERTIPCTLKAPVFDWHRTFH